MQIIYFIYNISSYNAVSIYLYVCLSIYIYMCVYILTEKVMSSHF